MLYLDTSLLVAALTREARTAEIQAWLATQPPDQLAISEWVITEFSGAMSLKLRSKHLRVSHRAEALAVFAKLAETTFTVLSVSALDFRAAARFADQHRTGLRSGDALHLAIVAQHRARLVTLDRQMAKAAQSLGLTAELL